jgi:hypothetical protein
MPGDKLPALSYGWQTRATDDPTQLAEWERSMDGLNWGVACGPSGLFVIDIDPAGMAAWQAMQERSPELRNAVARSYTVRTPRGGFHHYFRGQGPTTASAIAPGIDTRGGYLDDKTGKIKSIGYVVLPGSKTVAGPKTVDGVYEEIGGIIESLPLAVLAIMPEKKSGTVIGLERTPDLDQPRNVQWATDLLTNYVKEGRVSVEGNGGNNTAFQVAASILDKGISPARCYELLDELWNPHCSPAWDDWELETIIGNAAKYGEDTGAGSKGFMDNASAFSQFANYQVETEETAKPRQGRFRPILLRDARREKHEASWLIPSFLPSRGVGILYGLSGSYKTFIALDWALTLAHGLGGQWGAPPVKHKVVFLAGESRYALQQERVDAWCEWQGVDPDAEDVNFAIVPGVPAYGDKEGWEDVRDGLLEMKFLPELVAIDTLTRMQTGLDENSNDDQKLILKHCEEISDHYGCFTLLTAHTGKDESRGIRGAQVLVDNSDAVIMAKKIKGGTSLTVKKLKEVDIPDKSFFFLTKEFGKSIVLERTENAPAEEPKATSKISWSEPNEILKIIGKLGRTSHANLVQEIVSDLGIERDRVNKELRKRQDLNWLRDGDFWRIPGHEHELEFDL